MKKIILFLSAVILFVFWLNVIDFKVDAADITITSEDINNAATVGAPPETPTPTPTSTATPGTTATSTPTATPTSTPTPTPQALFSIVGYGPVNSDIKMTGIAVSEVTQSDETGYFEFVNPPFPTFFSSLVGHYYPELCFQATDYQNQNTMPVCIPPLPKNAVTKQVGPVILPPTISVNDGVSIKETQVVAYGSTTPNTEVDVFVAKKTKGNYIKLVSEVSAFYLPTYKVKSDANGHYEFSLPSNVSDEWRIFVSSLFQGAQSPKSNTLTYYIKPVSYKLVEIYEDSLRSVKPKLLMLIIGLEALILFILILLVSKQRKAYQKAGNTRPGNHIRALQTRYNEVQKEYLELLRRRGINV